METVVMSRAEFATVPAGRKRLNRRKRGEDLIDDFNKSRSEWEELIDQWIFNERDRSILKRRLLDGICFEPLAEEFDLSVRQTKSIVYKAQTRLFKHV